MKKTRNSRILLSILILVILAISITYVMLASLTHEPTPTPTPTPNYEFPIKIVGKQIPAGYVMGNPINLCCVSALSIENPVEKVSIRFTAKFSADVSTLTIYIEANKEQGQIKVGLQEDSSGIPKGEWINRDGFGTTQIPNKEGFLTVSLQRSVPILKGNVYHIVIEATEAVWVRAYTGNGSAEPLNNDDPDILSPDPNMNTLHYDGNKWLEADNWPVFSVGYSDGRSEGQPYSLVAPWVVYGSTYVGQTIIPASNYTIEKIAFVINLKGVPKENLSYEIRDSNNGTLARGLFAEASQLTNNKKWVEATLPSPVTLRAGILYRIFLLSPGTELENAYYLHGYEFSYNNTIGYGGLQHQITTSPTAGSIWFDNKDADAIFKLTTIGAPTDETEPTPIQTYSTVSVSEAKALIDSSCTICGDPIIILDVRTPEEFNEGHIKDAINIPVAELQGRLGELNENTNILVYCFNGMRSAQASQILVNNGFMKVYNMNGGITAWINEGLPTVTTTLTTSDLLEDIILKPS